MSFVDIALRLSRRGFAVFPITAGQKTPPLVKEWQRAATTDEAQIKSWGVQWPDANAGVHCADLLVLDVDPKKGGYDSLAVLEQEVFLESTFEVETPSGGRHIYYRCKAPARNGVDVLGPGIDVRATNGYVVAPGSVTSRGEYVIYVDEALADVPPGLMERLRAPSVDPRDRNAAAPDTDADAAVVRAKDFLRTHPAAVEGHGGDHHTFRTICRIRDFGVPEERAAEALEAWNERCTPPWEPGELAVKITNAYQYAQDAAGKLTPEALGFEAIPNVGTSEQVPTERNTTSDSQDGGKAELLHPADVNLGEILGTEYLIKGVLERQSNAVLFGHWNVGKAQPIDEMVLTPDGWRQMGEIRVGDYVIGSAGLPVRVRGVYPQGEKEEWEVEFANGSVVRACGEHLWKVFKNGGSAQIVTTEQLAVPPKHTYSRGRKSAAWNVPLCAPVNYTPSGTPLPLDPYVLGALLGDGGITAYVGFTSADAEIVEEIRRRLPAGHDLRHKDGYAYQIVSPAGQPNHVLCALRLLGIFGHKSSQKWVPDEYMKAAPGERLLLLQGLMDTDGWASGDRTTASVYFASSSRHLTEQVRELALSLGGIANQITTKETTGLPSYGLAFRLADGANPFRLPRKAERVGQIRAKHLGIRGARRTGRVTEMQCISVESPDQLYVTRDFVLTHNTFVVLDMAASIATGTQWFGKRVRQGRVLYLGYEGIRAMKKRMLALRGKYPALEDRNVPFEWHALRWPLTQGEGVKDLGAALAAYADRHGAAPDLVIVDPLANALGGDDADATLMGALNQCVATLIQKQHCTVLRVHHSGHGNQDRARGHSSLPAGVDTEIRVDEQEIALTKQRDDVRGKVCFKLEVVKLGKDADGDDVTTCIVQQVAENAMSPELTRPQQELLDALIKLRGDGGKVSKTDVRDCAAGADPEQRRKLLEVLERKQYLRADGTGWVIAERGPMAVFD